MPDRDYYFDEDKKEKREKYLEFVEKIMGAVGEDDGILIVFGF